MPQNKKAYQRAKLLDDFFSSGGKMNKEEMIAYVSKHIDDRSPEAGKYSERQMDYDIKHLRDGTYGAKAPLEYDRLHNEYYYSVPGFSVFNKEFDEEEQGVLERAIDELKGIGKDDLAGALSLIARRGNKESAVGNSTIFSYEQHPEVVGLKWIDILYEHIKKKNCLTIKYQPYGNYESSLQPASNEIPERDKMADEPIYRTICPYLLKQYRYRWYLVAFDKDREAISIFGLDRINKVDINKHVSFVENEIKWDTYFRDVIGLSVIEQNPVEKVLFRATPTLSKYIYSRPLHHSQKVITKDAIGWTFQLSVRKNIELLAELRRFGANLEVLEPQDLREEMLREFQKAVELYKKVQ
jgi:predicted DNA-binding transcriptional regulator YafY